MQFTDKDLIAAIEQADGAMLDEITDALRRRYRCLYPEEEIAFLSLPRYDSAERRRILEQILEMEASQPQEIAASLRSSQ